jgi:hypothetical protein
MVYEVSISENDLTFTRLSISVLNAKATTRIFPLDGTINTGDLASAAFQATGIFDNHLLLLVERIKVCRARIDAETFFAVMTDFLIKQDMAFRIVFASIKS